jgi:hypothetical protein
VTDSGSAIYVFLPREAVDVWAPVDAKHVRDDIYEIVNCRGEDEEVEFGAGSLVRCRKQRLSDGETLVAFEKIETTS